MLFVEFRFMAFFLVVFGVYWKLRANAPRKLWLLACSYFFYGCWNWRYLFLIAFSTTVDFFVGRALERQRLTRARGARWLLLSLGVNLGLLGAFKYYNFFIRSAQDFLAALGLHPHLGTLAFILPVGISFFTFQSLSYTIDVYRGHLRAVRQLHRSRAGRELLPATRRRTHHPRGRFPAATRTRAPLRRGGREARASCCS